MNAGLSGQPAYSSSMMLTIEHPEILPQLALLQYGLWPFKGPDGGVGLIVKAPKEAILASRLNDGFKIYLLEDHTGERSHLGLITAFFDDHDEPLVIKSLQYAGDAHLTDLTALMSQPEFNVHFFDEHDREMLGARARNPSSDRFRETIATATFHDFARDTFEILISRLEDRFSVRDAADDDLAFTIKLGERLFPDDFVLLDGRDEAYRFHGADSSLAANRLEREEPGAFQERDIAVLMGRIYEGSAIFLNPVRDDTGKELTDILVYDDRAILFIQAKDSPNTEASLRRSIDRKRAAVRGHILKAARQLTGALSHAKRASVLKVRRPDGPVELPVADRDLIGLVVVSELFDDDYAACSRPVLQVVRDTECAAILIDYRGLHIMAQTLRSPTRFTHGLAQMFEVAIDKDEFPKPAWIGPPPPEQ